MNDYIGSSFDDFLEEEDLLIGVEAIALKRPIVEKIKRYLKESKLTKTALAKQMNASLTQLDKLLDPECTNISLKMLVRLAKAMGKPIEIHIVD